MAGEIAQRLKLSNAERERVEWLVEKHQFLCDVRQMRTSKLKMILVHPGIRELLALHWADALASGRKTDHVEYCEYLLREWPLEVLNPPPLLTGHDLTRHGLEPGPRFKQLLEAVREAQLDGTISTPREALELVDRLVKEWDRKDSPTLPPLLTADDLIRHGLEPGPLFPRLLEAVRRAQLEGTITTTKQALEWADRLVEKWRGEEPPQAP
jgi:hypothetical protein